MFHGVFAGFQLLIFKGFGKACHIFVKYGALQHLKKPPHAIVVGNNQRSAHNNNCVLEADVQETTRRIPDKPICTSLLILLPIKP